MDKGTKDKLARSPGENGGKQNAKDDIFKINDDNYKGGKNVKLNKGQRFSWLGHLV
jgi:hypothetical protein